MPSIDDKTSSDNTEPPAQIVEDRSQTIWERSIGQYLLLGIAALVIGGAIYQRYPRTIEDATVIAKGEDHLDLFRDNGTDYPEHYTETQPSISLDKYNICLRGEGLEKLNVGDKLINVTYFLCPLTRCNCLKSYEKN